MSDAQRLARLVLILCWIAIAVAAILLVRAAVTGTLPFTSHPDPETGTAGLLVETDRGTGCQYIVTPWGGIVARTGPDGRQICTAAKP
jgi:hypothetical protein